MLNNDITLISINGNDVINTKMRSILDEATDPWGIKVNRVEVKNILPPRDIQEAMEKQMRAERERREKILQAEGEKKSSILIAEGEKESAILRAAFVAITELHPCAIFAKGPPWISTGECSRVCTRLGFMASLRSAAMAPTAFN